MTSIWKYIIALNQLGQTGLAVNIDNAQHFLFQCDRWIGGCALMLEFHHLFSL
jgi:hypothetical protein